LLEQDPTPFVHYLMRETGGLPYTGERFGDTYAWTLKSNMAVPGATHEKTFDNRARQ
jgi:hypothetical protein